MARDEVVELLRESEARYRDIVAHMPAVICELAPDGTTLFVNDAVTKATGYAPEELRAKNWWSVLCSEDQRLSANDVHVALQTSDTVEREVVIRAKDGALKTLACSFFKRHLPGTNSESHIGFGIDITERKRQEDQLAYLATHDPLTGLVNRRMLEEQIKRAVARARRGVASSLLLLDVDNFKLVNDTLGHSAGDRALAIMAQLIQNQLRREDVVARLGGDEFAVLLEGSDIESARGVAERMRDEAEDFILTIEDLSFHLSLSIGLVAIDGKSSPAMALSRADAAMYKAKDQGGNCAVLYSPEGDDTVWLPEANRLVILIKEALKKDLFVLHYQPVVRLSDGQVEYFEALVRLRGEKGKIIPPGGFIPAAERFGLMPQITRWIVQKAVHSLREHPEIRLSINLSDRDVLDETLPQFIEECLRENDVNSERLGFEINETAITSDPVGAEHQMRRLKALGCRLAIDDLGAGLAPFIYLRNLPVDQLKISGEFVRSLEKDPTQGALVRSIQTLASIQGKNTVAEFVESEAIARVLRDLGITHAQGFYFGSPSPKLPERKP